MRTHSIQTRTFGALALTATVVLSACQSDIGAKQGFGTIAGAAAGALLGSQIGLDGDEGQIVAVAIGTLAGALIGGEVGKSLDRADQLALQQATQTTLETARSGESLPWLNPDSGNNGTVVAQRPYSNKTGQYCREYTQTINIGSQTSQAYGTACRQPDGTWQIVNGS
jgi:surface antigen